MFTTIFIALVTVIVMVLSIIFKPYIKIKNVKLGLYAIITVIGAILVLIFKCISVKDAISGITANTAVNPLKILALFISMTLISVYLGNAGFFDYIADWVFKKTKGGGIKLFLCLYFIVSVLTIFTSNDIIILTFTPPICIFAKKAKISPIPYLIAEFIGANTWSMALIVGNPTNIYLAGSLGITFFEYFKVMALPSVVGGLTGLAVLILLFRKTLNVKGEGVESTSEKVNVNKFLLIVSLVHLVVCIILLAISDVIKVEMWIICVSLFVSLTIFTAVYSLVKDKNLSRVINAVKKAPFELIPFVLSMFVIVLALKNCGFTDIIAGTLIKNNKWDSVVFGYICAISSNLLNNIPMSVLFEKIISNSSVYALYGAVVGSNIGAFITPVGALAGIMWTKILVNYDVNLSFRKFTFYGTISAIFTLLSSTFVLMLMV